MKKGLIAFLLLGIIPLQTYATDIRDMVSSSDKVISETIIPDKSIYGEPYGMTENDFIKK